MNVLISKTPSSMEGARMPYIKQPLRNRLDAAIDLIGDAIEAAGPLETRDGIVNYVISRIVSRAFKDGDWRYKTIARCVAAFECAKLEFYRRIGTIQEERAIADNGDILEYQ